MTSKKRLVLFASTMLMLTLVLAIPATISVYAQTGTPGPYIRIGPPDDAESMASFSDGDVIHVVYEGSGIYYATINSGPGGRAEELNGAPELVIDGGTDPAIALSGDGRTYIVGDTGDETSFTTCDENEEDCDAPRDTGTDAETGEDEDTQIVFYTFRDGNYQVYTMNPDGSGQTNLSNNENDDYGPSISPDGAEIVFTSFRDGTDQIYVMTADGTDQTSLSNNTFSDYYSNWSPDGSQILFTSLRDGTEKVYVMDADGDNQMNLTDTEDGFNDSRPSWSPDGSKIAFSSDRDGNWEIYLMDPDGSNQVNLTNDPDFDSDADWSPDGLQIAFTSTREGGDFDVFVMDADGENPTALTDNDEWDSLPDWSPDGSQITYHNGVSTEFESTHFQIFVMDADGENPTNISNNPDDDFEPNWGILDTGVIILSASSLDTDNQSVDFSLASADSTTSTTTSACDASTPRIAASGDDLYIVQVECNDIIFYASHDGGQTFEEPEGLNLSNNAGVSKDPRIAITGSGTIVVTWQDNTPGNDEIFYSRSTDGGETFNGGSPVGSPKNLSMTNKKSDDHQLMALGANVYVVWVDYKTGNGDIYFKASKNDGSSFGSTKNLSKSTLSFLSSRDPDLAAHGTKVSVTWAVYLDKATKLPGEIIFRESLNKGDSFGKHILISKTLKTDSKTPQIDYTPYGERYLAWLDKGGPARSHISTGTYAVLAVGSYDGVKFSAPINLTDDPANPKPNEDASLLEVVDNVAVWDPSSRRG